MPSKITFTQAEESAIVTAIKYLPDAGATKKALESLIAKMKKAREPGTKKFHGISVAAFMSLASDKFGTRLKKLPNAQPDWYVRMQRSIDSAGITEEIAIKGLERAAVSWSGDVWIEKLIYSLSQLAAGVTVSQSGKNVKTGTQQSGWLNRLNQDIEL